MLPSLPWLDSGVESLLPLPGSLHFGTLGVGLMITRLPNLSQYIPVMMQFSVSFSMKRLADR